MVGVERHSLPLAVNDPAVLVGPTLDDDTELADDFHRAGVREEAGNFPYPDDVTDR